LIGGGVGHGDALRAEWQDGGWRRWAQVGSLEIG
jgi:hypothetical protein